MSKLTWLTARLPEPNYLPTPSFGINRALGGKGLSSGRIHVYWGVKASGKSTMSFQQIAQAQREGKTCAYIDAERAFSPEWAEKCGVDLDSLNYIRANVAEDILELLLPDLASEKIDLTVCDSLSSINFRSFFEKADSNPMGSAARSSKFFAQKILECLNFNQQVILISHASMDLSGYHPTLTASVGSAISHWASTMIKIQKTNGKDNVREDGSFKVKWKIDKSKQSVYPVEGEYYFNPHTAEIDTVGEICTYAVQEEIVDRRGAWYYYGDSKWQGETKFLEALRLDKALYQELTDILNSIEVEALEEDVA